MTHVSSHIIIQQHRTSEQSLDVEYTVDMPRNPADSPKETAEKLEKVLKKLDKLNDGTD